MNPTRYESQAVYYGGYPGSSGKPVAGRLRWRDGVLTFDPGRAGNVPPLRFEQNRLQSVRRSEEGMTGARRVRLLIDVQTEDGALATLKFEMAGFWPKARKLARWLAVLGPVCGEKEAKDV